MNFLRKNKISFNNFEQLNILNDLYNIPKIVDNRYKLSSKSKKKTKTIYLEKSSPNHFPQYVKLTKRLNNDFSKSQEEKKKSFTNRNINKNNFDNLSQVRNSLYTDISQNPMNNNPIYSGFNKNINKTNNINDLTNSFVTSQEDNNEIINNLKRNNRFIPISPSYIPKKDIIANKEKNNNKVINNIEVEENIKNKNIDDYNKKHKIRYLLSKNYCGKRLIKRKYIINSPISIPSTFNKNSNIKNINLKKNLNFTNNNNNKDIEKTPNEKYSSNNINSPITISNITDINKYKNLIRTSLKKLHDKNPIHNTPITTSEVQSNVNRNNLNIEEIGLSGRNINNIFLRNDNNKNEIKIKLNDLIFFEERLNDIIISIKSTKNIRDISSLHETMEFIYFYCNSSLQNKFPLFFIELNRIIIKSAFNLHLFMIILLHYLSQNSSILIQALIFLRKIFNLLKINLYLIIRKIEIYYGEEFCQNNEIFFKVFNIFLKDNGLYDLKEKEIIEIINKNCISITIDIERILNYIQKVNVKYYLDFKEMYITISKINENDIIDYFYYNLNNNSNNKENDVIIPQKSSININGNKEESTENNILIEQNQDNEYLDQIIISYKKNKKIPPFIKLKSKKKYTLVLDLEDTLINVKIDNDGNILCRPRPGLISFLNGIKPFYEIITFTKLSKEYSDIITKEIEGNKKLFDYNLYREHCTLIGREFIKDIGRIGRDMTKIVMVDDLEENLNYYPSNGILISPYNGESDKDDRVLFELKKILISFFRMGYEDIRLAIKNFKKEINNKITFGNV